MYTEAAKDIIIQSVGVGLILSLIFTETLGLAAGGMVVPGYVALMLHHPLRIVGTILVSLLTFLAIKFLSNYMFIYGRRRTVMVILVGFLFGWLSREILVIQTNYLTVELQTIGLIIPGLIANWMERQGVVKTISTMIIAAIMIRLILMIITGGEVFLREDWII
ncbi:MAG: poly-gamma-glutamate biosynthesis protein PgsC [Ignavibacteriales bacterium]|nr:poly-gamma-glutamate biosynthesis protein PgsC [Ignavibacteriales bacterium]